MSTTFMNVFCVFVCGTKPKKWLRLNDFFFDDSESDGQWYWSDSEFVLGSLVDS